MSGTDGNVMQLVHQNAMTAAQAAGGGGGAPADGEVQPRRPVKLDFSSILNNNEDPSTPAPAAPRGDNTPVTPVEGKRDNSSTTGETTHTSGN